MSCNQLLMTGFFGELKKDADGCGGFVYHVYQKKILLTFRYQDSYLQKQHGWDPSKLLRFQFKIM